MLRGLLVVGAGYLASLACFVAFFTGVALFTTEPARPFSGAALLVGGVLLLPPGLYYGAGWLTARLTPLTLTWRGRLRWSLTAYALTMLITILLDFSRVSFLLAAIPAAFVIGRRTFLAALAACALLTCAVIVLW